MYRRIADIIKYLFNNFYKSILNKDKSRYVFPTLKDGYRELVICDAIIKSSRINKWKNINVT